MPYSVSAVKDKEPAVITTLVEAAIGVAAVFGLDLTPEQTIAVMTFVGLLLNFFYVRPKTVTKAALEEAGQARAIAAVEGTQAAPPPPPI